MKKTRYAIVGTGSRAHMFINAILKRYTDRAELVGMCDLNQTRMDYWNNKFAQELKTELIPTYKACDFEKMITEQKVDTVIVTTMDRTHHLYICKAMEMGCQVISEKPLTTDAEKCGEIFECVERTKKNLRVTFNYRYSPRNSKIKEIIQAGEIGDVVSVHFEWMLNTKHGADYFRRWHRDKNNSGGLMVHKSTHHFDLVNWWLNSAPEEVFGMGRLAFYGRENAEKRGEGKFYDRCQNSENAKNDPFAIHMEDHEGLKGLYLNAEHEDGYIRDQSVFGHNISIEDTMSVLVRYKNKATLTYSLNAFCPWEGYRVSFNGTKGRLELDVVESPYVSGSNVDQNNPDHNLAQKDSNDESEKITLQKLWSTPQNITWEESKGGHGGGDNKMLDDIFIGRDNDPLKTAANVIDGAKSILVGIAANRSFQTRLPVIVEDLFPLASYTQKLDS